MVNDILDGITNALYNNFVDTRIHTDSLEQGFTEPCFFVLELAEEEIPLLNLRAKRNITFNVQYFPSQKSNRELREMASKLFPVLKRIELLDGTLLNGFNLRNEIVDGVLHFFVEYKPIIRYKSEQHENMENMSQNINVKG